MDLPGPKLRTGPLPAGPRVVRLRPSRDDLGRSVEPARARLVAAEDANAGPTSSSEPSIPVPGRWLSGLHDGDRIRLRDTRGSHRILKVVEARGAVAVVEVDDTTYVATGTTLVARSGSAEVGRLPPVRHGVVLRLGDRLTLTSNALSGVEPESEESGADDRNGTGALRIGCTLPEALEALEIGHQVLFDDGKIAGVVEAIGDGWADIRITAARANGSRLRAEKGINMPDSELLLPAFGPEEESILPFVVRNADLVGLSFAQTTWDVEALQQRIHALGCDRLGIVLKIETQRGFAALPDMLLTAMRSPLSG
jgi:pyruvate kinase